MISNITKAHLNYGSIIGLILYGLFNLYLYTFDINPLGNIKWLSVIVQYTILFIFLKKIKLEFLKDTPTFKFIFRSAMLIVLYYATLFGGLVYLHGIFLDSLFVDKNVDESLTALAELDEQGIGNIMGGYKERFIEEIKSMTVGKLAYGEVMTKILGGMLFSALFALILKEKQPLIQPPFDESTTN